MKTKTFRKSQEWLYKGVCLDLKIPYEVSRKRETVIVEEITLSLSDGDMQRVREEVELRRR